MQSRKSERSRNQMAATSAGPTKRRVWWFVMPNPNRNAVM